MTAEGVVDNSAASTSWLLYTGTGRTLDADERSRRWPAPPPWRDFEGAADETGESSRRLGRGAADRRPDAAEVNAVNAALYLRRPLLVTGDPGVGKSSLAYRMTRELRLGPVLHWPITSRSSLRSGLYDYDAIGRAQAAGERTGRSGDVSESNIGDFIHLGPLGTALLPNNVPRVLLIDEMDKGDIDLPNDLLNVFEDGWFAIPELVRVRSQQASVTVHTADPGESATIRDGTVRCTEFPIVVITSNGEREFPPAFLRRCIRLDLQPPDVQRLSEIVAAHFPDGIGTDVRALIEDFVARRKTASGILAADQLLNAIYLASAGAKDTDGEAWRQLLDTLLRSLSAAER